MLLAAPGAPRGRYVSAQGPVAYWLDTLALAGLEPTVAYVQGLLAVAMRALLVARQYSRAPEHRRFVLVAARPKPSRSIALSRDRARSLWSLACA